MQLSNYKDQTNMIAHQMKAQNQKPQHASKMMKMMTSAGITINCAKDSSTEHIAEMLIQGTNMGVIKINKALNRTSSANPKVIQ